ncbi:hypothetical protein ABKV19_013848 [Rosa sericea]
MVNRSHRHRVLGAMDHSDPWPKTDTALWAKDKRGATPLHMVDWKVRQKVFQSTYWKDQCFMVRGDELVDRAVGLDHIGGLFGIDRNPTPFLCLLLKMLQIQPEKHFVIDFIQTSECRYVRVLGAFYLRLKGSDADMCQYLEPLQLDGQKLRRRLPEGSFASTHVGAVIDELLTKDHSCDIALPRTMRRWTLKSLGLEMLPGENTSVEVIQGEGEEEQQEEGREENDQDLQQQRDGNIMRLIGSTARRRMERNRCPYFHAYRGHPYQGLGRDHRLMRRRNVGLTIRARDC